VPGEPAPRFAVTGGPIRVRELNARIEHGFRVPGGGWGDRLSEASVRVRLRQLDDLSNAWITRALSEVGDEAPGKLQIPP
jgi:hypothetical protein